MRKDNYSQSKYGRREQAISVVDLWSEDQPNEYRGRVTLEESVSTNDLLRSLQQ
ncbi:DUF5786 family protein [Natronococcus sp. A-GB7]|uniref:DUF5786 family protein n=1 Tax=Natronococcus sp. A-GB7 TaxID=3037649 RepID=UPI00241BF2D7|nr:DUF5786 family protein [Natronococcus sp. A-GB7]MDG5821389.1 DUF5786 family protein [Natronococcus sp. A-GB7]